MGSLFVPSISTKTISASTGVLSKKWNPLNSNNSIGFIILVSNVAIVELKNKPIASLGGITIDMPSITKLPVSRDDIILDSVTAGIFINNIFRSFRDVKKLRNVIGQQQYLQLYYNYTASSINKISIRTAINTFTKNNIAYLVTESVYNNIYTLDPKCIASETMSIPDVEERLIKELKLKLIFGMVSVL